MSAGVEVCGCIYDQASGKFWEPQDIGFSFKHYHEDDLSFELKECTHGAVAPKNQTEARFQLHHETNGGSSDGSNQRRSHGHSRHGDRRSRESRQRDKKAHSQSQNSETRSARN